MARDVRAGRGAGDAPGARDPQGLRARAREARAVRARALAPRRSQAGMQRERQGGFRRFVLESVGELRKVDWPTQKHLVSAVLAVIVACVVVGVFLYVADEALSRFVRDVLLRG